MMAIYGSTALLPTRTNINPSDPEGATYFEAGQTLYILKDGNKLRCASSFGLLHGWGVGTRHEAHHDQAGYRLGYFEVVGLVRTDVVEGKMTTVTVGEIPNRKIPHWVFK